MPRGLSGPRRARSSPNPAPRSRQAAALLQKTFGTEAGSAVMLARERSVSCWPPAAGSQEGMPAAVPCERALVHHTLIGAPKSGGGAGQSPTKRSRFRPLGRGGDCPAHAARSIVRWTIPSCSRRRSRRTSGAVRRAVRYRAWIRRAGGNHNCHGGENGACSSSCCTQPGCPETPPHRYASAARRVHRSQRWSDGALFP